MEKKEFYVIPRRRKYFRIKDMFYSYIKIRKKIAKICHDLKNI